MNIRKTEFLYRLTRVTTRPGQFLHDILQGWQPGFSGNIFLNHYGFSPGLILYQVSDRATQVSGHLSDYVIALRVHGRGVERVGSASYPEESRSLFKSLLSHPFHLHQFSAGAERTVLRPVIDDVLRHLRADT